MANKLWQDWVILAAAFWLFASPFVLDYASLTSAPAWIAFIAALVLFASASEALVVLDPVEEWVDGLAGLALMASPWVAGFADDRPVAWNHVAVGFVVTVCAISALVRDVRLKAPGHGDHPGAAAG
jgi:hypothetical protein